MTTSNLSQNKTVEKDNFTLARSPSITSYPPTPEPAHLLNGKHSPEVDTNSIMSLAQPELAQPTAPSVAESEPGKKSIPVLQSQSNLLPTKQVVIVIYTFFLANIISLKYCKIQVFIGAAMAITLSLLDATMVSVALPQITADFNAGSTSSWVASANLLTQTVSPPIWGR